MSPTSRGRAAETEVARHILDEGGQILARNWRTRYCEIDLVVRRRGAIHFVEVKYRADLCYGNGFNYIGFDKTSRLIRAAAAWCQAHSYDGPYQIDVAAVTTNAAGEFEIELLENAVTA